MMRSLYSGVSGLKTHQTRMDVIGNNIANVNTTAYKSQSITFSELMYQTTQKASGPNANSGTAGVNARQIGLGVKSGAISTAISTSGATQTTGNPFDLRITGDSFFIVSNGSSNFFTRDGSFYVDAIGNLAMSSNGYNVMGWGVDQQTQTIKKDTVQPLRIMSADNMTYPPEATSQAYVSGIIDKRDKQVTDSEDGKMMNLSFYDALGYAYTAKLSMKGTSTDGVYTVELNSVLDDTGKPIDTSGFRFGTTQAVADAKTLSLSSGYTISGGNTLNYTDENGAAQNISLTGTLDDNQKAILAKAFGYSSYDAFSKLNVDNGGTAVTIGSLVDAGTLPNAITAENTIVSPSRMIQGGVISYDVATGVLKSVNGVTPKKDDPDATKLVLGFGDRAMPAGPFAQDGIKIDFSTSSNFDNNGTSTINADPGDLNGLGVGRKLGEMSGIAIQKDGMIYASYDNGQTRLLGQIAVAEFSNAMGLEKEGDNLYSATLNSGEFDGIGVDISANGGYMETGVLEMSNVDLSAEFTDMITAQRGFQANSRIITVSDTLLEELVNLKR